MTNFLIAAVVVCLALIARMLWRIQQALVVIVQRMEMNRSWTETFWRRQLSGPEHACDGKRIWIRRSLDRNRDFDWDLRTGNGASEITDLGGSICNARARADVDAKES